jgi:hypothetical protein
MDLPGLEHTPPLTGSWRSTNELRRPYNFWGILSILLGIFCIKTSLKLSKKDKMKNFKTVLIEKRCSACHVPVVP